MRPRLVLMAGMLLALWGCSGDPPKDPNERSAAKLYLEKGVRYMEMGELEIALRDLEHSVELDGRDSESRNALAVLYGRLNLAAKAEEQFKRALALDENNSGAVNNYGRFLCAQGKQAQAMELFQKLIDSPLYKSPWLALTNAGLCARGQGDQETAEQYLRRALEAAPEFPPALLEMARLSLERGQYLSARAFVQRYESVADPSPEAMYLGAEVERALGNMAVSRQYVEQLRRRFPDSPQALRLRKYHSAH